MSDERHHATPYEGLEPLITYWLGDWEYASLYAGPGVGTFRLNMGGDDYYASEVGLNVAEATKLRDRLNAWLVQQEESA